MQVANKGRPELVFYCSKCAILLVSQGKKVMENSELARKAQIEEFGAQAKASSKKIQFLKQSIDIKKFDVYKFYELQLSKIEEVFREFEGALKVFKQGLLQKFQAERDVYDTLYSDAMSTLAAHQQEIDRMNGDITLNYQKIITAVEPQPFQEIMAQYAAKVRAIDEQIESVKQKQFLVTKCESKFPDERDSLLQKIQALLESSIVYKQLSTAIIKKGIYQADQK